MENLDFIVAMENFDSFIETEIKEDENNSYDYPVGIGFGGVKVHFMHYKSFSEAVGKWNERKRRIDKNNMCIWLTNFNPCNELQEEELINRFNKLPFSNKLIFSGKKIDKRNVIYLKGYDKVKFKKNIFGTKNIFGMRYIDQFEYVNYLNAMQKQ